jgi:hypothetical protein
MKLLTQKRLFNQRNFELTDKVLKVKTKSLKEKAEYEIKLEDIGNRITYHSDNMIIKHIIVGLFALVPIGLIIHYLLTDDPEETSLVVNCIIWIPLTIFLMLLKGKEDTHIVGGQQIVTFYQNTPNKKEVDEFANLVIKSSTDLIRKKYMKVDSDLPEETQMNTFHWLLNNEFISQKEYEGLKEDYKTNKLL